MSCSKNDSEKEELSPREKDMNEFHSIYSLEINRKRRRQLLEMSDDGFVAYKAGLDISFGCRVS